MNEVVSADDIVVQDVPVADGATIEDIVDNEDVIPHEVVLVELHEHHEMIATGESGVQVIQPAPAPQVYVEVQRRRQPRCQRRRK